MKGKKLKDITFGEAAKILCQQDGYVKVGCKSSSGFFYAWKKSDLTEEKISEIEYKLDKKMRNSVRSAENAVTNAINHIPTVRDYVHKQWKEQESFGTLDGFLRELQEAFNRLAIYKTTLEGRRADYEQRVRLQDKKIVDAYPSTDMEDEVIILVEGVESGPYWDRTEYGIGNGYLKRPLKVETETEEEE